VSHWPPSDLPDFDKWWEEHGQFVRSGGTEYTRTFAYEAWKFLKGDAPVQPAEPKKRHYFVSYNFQAEGHSGNGCLDLVREKPIRNWEDVDGICKFIAEYKGFKSVALTGWQHYEEDET
jgi:hypothetical protein